MYPTALAWILLLVGTLASGQRAAQTLPPLPPAPPEKNSQPVIQFDTRGIEFGPWIRRYIRYLNTFWIVRDLSTAGRVVVTFHLSRNGTVSDIDLVNLTSVEEFATAARAAVDTTRVPLPQDYPEERARFLITFIYNAAPTKAELSAPLTSEGVASLQHSTAAEVERRIGRPTTTNGTLWRYVTPSGDFVVVFDDTMRVWTALPSSFDLASIEK